MNDATVMAGGREIIVEPLFPHPPELVWKTLTTPAGEWEGGPGHGRGKGVVQRVGALSAGQG
jgi:hypothetical protein